MQIILFVKSCIFNDVSIQTESKSFRVIMDMHFISNDYLVSNFEKVMENSHEKNQRKKKRPKISLFGRVCMYIFFIKNIN